MILKVKRLVPEAILPTRGSKGAVGYDLYAAETVTLYSGRHATVGTGIAVAIPEGCYGRIAPRSGLAARYGIDVLGGVVDPDYRGEVKVVLANLSDGLTDTRLYHFIDVHRGERIAQLIIERCETPDVVETDDLDATERGAGGFGSTGA